MEEAPFVSSVVTFFKNSSRGQRTWPLIASEEKPLRPRKKKEEEEKPLRNLGFGGADHPVEFPIPPK